MEILIALGILGIGIGAVVYLNHRREKELDNAWEDDFNQQEVQDDRPEEVKKPDTWEY